MSDDDLQIPTPSSKFADDLAELDDAKLFIPAERDDAIRAAARARFAPRQTDAPPAEDAPEIAGRIGWFTGVPSAIAAGLLVALTVWVLIPASEPDLGDTVAYDTPPSRIPAPGTTPGDPATPGVDPARPFDPTGPIVRNPGTPGAEGLPDIQRVFPRLSTDAADVDGSGTVDIVDAFTLARRIQNRQAADTAHDVNADGRIDAIDVQLIAARAVALRSPGGAG